MRVIVDRERCTGHGRCNAMGPAVYPLDDEGRNALTDLDVPSELEDQARLGADACPERAITIVA